MNGFDDAMGGAQQGPVELNMDQIRAQAEAQIPPLKAYTVEYLDGEGNIKSEGIVANAVATAENGKAAKFISMSFVPAIMSIRQETLWFISSDYLHVRNNGPIEPVEPSRILMMH